jgi:YfiH family protein
MNDASPLFHAVDWPAPAAVSAVFTDRQGGVSRGPYAGFNLGLRSGDDAAAVLENRRRLRAALALPGDPAWLRQVHGARAVAAPLAEAEPAADASYTREPGVACAILTADCLPVLFCSDDGAVVGAAHAGWRGLAGGVLEATVAAMGVAPARLLAWLGPAIGPQSFEVGQDVFEAFAGDDAGAAAAFVATATPGKFHADLFALARRRLSRAGVERQYGGGIDTCSNPSRFFSFRRDGVTGRQAALIWLRR